jgi:hypothetical protein
VGRLLLSFVLSYLILFVVLNSVLYIGPLDARYMSPLYPPLVLLSVQAVIFYLQRSRDTGHRFYGYVLYVFLGLTSVYMIVRFGKNAVDHSRSGSGYQSQSWKDDEIVHYIRKEHFSTLILSNNPMPFILLNGQESYAPVMPLAAYGAHSKTVYVEWKDDKALGYLKIHKDLRNIKTYRLQKVKTFRDGEVYEIHGVR